MSVTDVMPALDHADLLRLAYGYATDSPDPSTQNGAFLATLDGHPIPGTSACNAFPRGVAYADDRWTRPLKYDFIEHAEAGAIYAAARAHVHTEGLMLVCPWAACPACARAIVQAGITHLLRVKVTADAHWAEPVAIGDTILAEGGIHIIEIDGPLGGCAPLRRNGEILLP